MVSRIIQTTNVTINTINIMNSWTIAPITGLLSHRSSSLTDLSVPNKNGQY
jgi:hypothetical protein